MPAKADKAPIRAKSTKTEIQREFDEIQEQPANARESANPKIEEALRPHETEAPEAVGAATVESAVQRISGLGLERKELGRLHKTDVAATAPDQRMRRISATPAQAEFLLSIVRPPGRLAPDIEDWSVLLRLARDHGVISLLDGRVPADQVQDLRWERHRNTARNLALASELLNLLRAFESEGIPALPFKGVVLAAGLYGDLSHRRAGDLDILIYRQHLMRATAVLKERGYKLRTPVNDDGTPVDSEAVECQFTQESLDGITVELRWRLTSPHFFRRDFGMDALWPQRRRSILLGSEVPDLRPEQTLVVLCVHGTKHGWMRLFWICDVVRLLLIHPELDWDSAEREARRFGLWRTLGLGVLLAHRIGGAPVAAETLQRFVADRSVRRLEKYIRTHLFGEVAAISGLRFSQALESGDRLRCLVRLGLRRPNERDRAVIRLPRTLDFLYYAVRPLRVIWEYFLK